jgi:hypothetical protein
MQLVTSQTAYITGIYLSLADSNIAKRHSMDSMTEYKEKVPINFLTEKQVILTFSQVILLMAFSCFPEHCYCR